MGTIKNGYKWLGAKIGGNSVNGIAKGGNIIYKKIDPTLILDCDFNNNFTNKVLGGVQLIAGNVNGLPTFTLEGGEYVATFNGSKSLKTASNFILNSDKVSICFWMKTSQTATAIITELSKSWYLPGVNAFSTGINNIANKLFIAEQTIETIRNIRESTTNINDNTWKHIVAVIDRANPTATKITLYINGVLAGTTATTNGSTTGNFVNNILYIGQRAGNSSGFNGKMKFLKIFNYPLSTTEITNLYNKTM